MKSMIAIATGSMSALASGAASAWNGNMMNDGGMWGGGWMGGNGLGHPAKAQMTLVVDTQHTKRRRRTHSFAIPEFRLAEVTDET